MTGVPTHLTTEVAPILNVQAQVQLLAAEAVLAHLSGRASLRVEKVKNHKVLYALEPDLHALQSNRGLLEDVVMTALAQQEAAKLLDVATVQTDSGRDAAALLCAGLTEPDEQAVSADYLRVLRARTRATLRCSWAEIQVVAAGLLEHGELDADALKYRVQCAQGIRGTLLN